MLKKSTVEKRHTEMSRIISCNRVMFRQRRTPTQSNLKLQLNNIISILDGSFRYTVAYNITFTLSPVLLPFLWGYKSHIALAFLGENNDIIDPVNQQDKIPHFCRLPKKCATQDIFILSWMVMTLKYFGQKTRSLVDLILNGEIGP